MVILKGGGGVIADLNRTIMLILAHGHCVFYYFQHAYGRHLITRQNENRFLAFGSLISIAEIDNALFLIIVCSKFSEM